MRNLRLFPVVFQGSTLIIAPTGPISNLAGNEIQPEINELLTLLQEDRCRNIVIDMEKATFFGSVLLGAINSLWKQARNRQGRLVLCGLSDVGREVIHVAKFDMIWPIYASRQEALEALADE